MQWYQQALEHPQDETFSIFKHDHLGFLVSQFSGYSINQ